MCKACSFLQQRISGHSCMRISRKLERLIQCGKICRLLSSITAGNEASARQTPVSRQVPLLSPLFLFRIFLDKLLCLPEYIREDKRCNHKHGSLVQVPSKIISAVSHSHFITFSFIFCLLLYIFIFYIFLYLCSIYLV